MFEGMHRGRRQQAAGLEGLHQRRIGRLDEHARAHAHDRRAAIAAREAHHFVQCLEVIVDVHGMDGDAKAAQAAKGAGRVDAPGGTQDLDGTCGVGHDGATLSDCANPVNPTLRGSALPRRRGASREAAHDLRDDSQEQRTLVPHVGEQIG